MKIFAAVRLRAAAALAVLAAFLVLAPAAQGADVVTDGDMEAAGIGAWPHSNVTGVNSSAKATDQAQSGQSLKGTSATGDRVNVEWYNAQSVGTVAAGSTVRLSLWWGARYNASTNAAQGTLYVDVRPAAGAWGQVWSNGLTPSTTFTSGTVTNLDVSAGFPGTDTYEIRLRFVGRTGRNAAANVNIWWDNVVLDVASPATTTVGNGADPANASLCPGGTATALDAFTLQASTGTDSVTAVTVSLAAGSAAALSLVEITNDAGTVVYGSAANPAADVVAITLGTPIPVTTTATQYKVRVTPRSQAALPAPPGLSYAVTGTVTAVTSSNPRTYADAGSATVTIDNASPGSPTGFTGTPSDGQVSLTWTNPGSPDFAGVIVLRSTAPIGDAPAEGSVYAAGNTIGSSTVVYAGTGTSHLDTTVSNGTAYYYKAFARDGCANWSAGAAAGPYTPARTTTVGNGVNPANAALCPGGGATPLDAFTLQTTGGTDTVTGVTVSLAAGTAAGLALVEVTNDAGTVVYGSAANPPADTVVVSLSSSITATTSAVPYKLRVTPRSHAAMPAPAGATYLVTGTVTALASANNKVYSDTSSATVTVDNGSPANPSALTGVPGEAQVSLTWTNPADADFAGVLVLRSTAAVADTPTEGLTYVAGNTIGASTVVYAGSGAGATDTGLTNGTPYYYEIFARDACGNWSTGAAGGPYTPARTTAVANGVDPGSQSLCPGNSAAYLDAFTLRTTSGTDTVTALQVALAPGTAAALALLEVTNDAGSVVYGSVVNPSDAQGVSLGAGIPVTTTATQYKLRVTPRTHAAMPAPPGLSYAVTGTVTGITCTNPSASADTGSATLTVDNASPANPAGFGGTPGSGQVALAWTNPGSDFASMIVLRGSAPVVDNPVEGTTYTAGATIGASSVVYAGSGTAATDTGLTNGTPYYYRAFSRDACTNWSVGVASGPHVPVPATQNGTTTGTATAVKSSCKQITVTAPFTGDDDRDGSVKVEYNTTNTWPGTTACAAVTGGSPRQCLVVGLAASTSYYVRVTSSDPDGVSGTNPQVLGPIAMGTCGADSAAPTVGILAPARGAVVGGAEVVKVQVYDATGLAVSNPVQWSVDAGAYAATGVAVNARYSCGTGCAVYEFPLDTTALAYGPHVLSVQATDAAGNVTRRSWPVRVNNAGTRAAGSGQLLRRTPGAQICVDCHDLPTHSSQSTSTKYGSWAVECLDCHTPHRTRNIYLIGETVTTPNSGDKAVLLHLDDRVGETNPGSAPGNYSFLGDRSLAGNAPYGDGICEACHTRTNFHRNDATGDHAHNADVRCIKCHGHDKGFAGAGGACLDCHSTGGAGTGGPNNRRPVEVDFAKTSHHVGNGGSMGGTLTNFDCVVCHAEGTISGGQTGTTAKHMDGKIDFYNADNTAVVYTYDKSAVATAAGAAPNWNSGNATWRTQTSGSLDPFCLTCHDSDGATATFNATDGGSALNPFGDGTITNNYDQQNRTRVVDVQRMVSGTPPADGQYARHAIRGQSASVYTKYTVLGGTYKSIYEQGFFTSMGTDEGGKPNWNDTSVMGCGDCHTVDGANGTNGNAHGSGSEYLLKDASGTANLGTQSGGSYVCWRCHTSAEYLTTAHTGNASDWNDGVGLVGTARMTSAANKGKGSIFGIACMNCHGGAPGNGETVYQGFGRIHGTTQTFNNGAGGTRQAYRFTNGGGLRFYNPNGWTGTSATCYTLGSADGWSSCTQHSGGTGHTRSLTRPLTY